jgi:hypothetical protein
MRAYIQKPREVRTGADGDKVDTFFRHGFTKLI